MAGAGTDYFNVFVDALGAFEARVILSIGKEINRSMLKQLPSNFEINQDASHLEILPHAALSICQGGMGSTLEALYHGVPVIALPLTRFHEEVTYRMAELGLGYSLPRLKATPAVIRECVHRVLSDRALLGRVRQMQQLFRAVDGARRAADCVEEFLSDKRCAS
jgi:MGT family glycosyltransferase